VDHRDRRLGRVKRLFHLDLGAAAMEFPPAVRNIVDTHTAVKPHNKLVVS
jgi:hypothetical protein